MRTWRKIAAVTLWLAVCAIVSCGRKPEKILRADSKDLKDTIITAHLEEKIVPGKNLIYCSTFQLAWNELRDNIIGEDIRLADEPPMVKILNKKLTTRDDLSEDCYVAMAGFGKATFLERVEDALKSKFGDRAPRLKGRVKPNSIMMYAFLLKELEFGTPFESLERPILFRTEHRWTEVKGFGIDEYNPRHARHQELRKQLSILAANAATGGCIVQLHSKSPKDEIILAKMEPRKTLLQTIQKVQKMIVEKGADDEDYWEFDQYLLSGAPLTIPKIDFDIGRSYSELIGKDFLNESGGQNYIAQARQEIRFTLNEKGAVLESEALVGVEGGEAIFNGPFLLYLKEKQAKYPYLAIWVDNPEILMKW